MAVSATIKIFGNISASKISWLLAGLALSIWVAEIGRQSRDEKNYIQPHFGGLVTADPGTRDAS